MRDTYSIWGGTKEVIGAAIAQPGNFLIDTPVKSSTLVCEATLCHNYGAGVT
jgi:hypothetical protein